MAVVLAIQAVTSLTQAPTGNNDGQGFDGAIYHEVAAQLAQGERPSGTSRFVRRLGTPFLAALVDSEDLVNGFKIVNTSATLVSALLLLAWFRRALYSSSLRIGLVVLYATHWLQLVRFTFFCPVLVDAGTQVFCFAGLNCVAWYEETRGRWPLLLMMVISVAGVFFREVVLLIPLALLFARNPGVQHQPGFPYFRFTNLPRVEQWIPLVLASAALLWIGDFVIASDQDFSAWSHLATRASSRDPISYLLGWMVAFGPVLFVILFDWRKTVEFLSRHKAFSVFALGVAAIGWAGSLESERHALNWASPVVYVMLGRTIERHVAWFRSVPLVALLLTAQALVHRLFLETPQADEAYSDRLPTMLLTPIGDGLSYLHLFPDYVSADLARVQFGQYALLGAVILVWLSRRAYLDSASTTTATASAP